MRLVDSGPQRAALPLPVAEVFEEPSTQLFGDRRTVCLKVARRRHEFSWANRCVSAFNALWGSDISEAPPDVSRSATAEPCLAGIREAVKAVVVLKPGTSATERDIIDLASQHLASYQKPKSVDFVDSLPKAPTGKILKRELRDPYWAAQGKKL